MSKIETGDIRRILPFRKYDVLTDTCGDLRIYRTGFFNMSLVETLKGKTYGVKFVLGHGEEPCYFIIYMK